MKKTLLFVLPLFLLTGCGQSDQSSNPSHKSMGGSSVSKGISSESDKLIAEGVAHLKDSDIVAAIRSFDGAIQKNPKNSKAYIVLSETYMRMNQAGRAIDTLLALLTVDPTNADGHYMIAVAYGINGDQDQAVRHAQKSAEFFQSQKDQEGFVKALSLLNSFRPADE